MSPDYKQSNKIFCFFNFWHEFANISIMKYRILPKIQIWFFSIVTISPKQMVRKKFHCSCGFCTCFLSLYSFTGTQKLINEVAQCPFCSETFIKYQSQKYDDTQFMMSFTINYRMEMFYQLYFKHNRRHKNVNISFDLFSSQKIVFVNPLSKWFKW